MPTPANPERRLAAILAADLEGYSKHMAADEIGAFRRLTERRDILDRLIAAHRGRIANTAGDSVLAEFASIVDAVQCAVTAQAALAKANKLALPDPEMKFRMGLHVGDVMINGSDMLGDGVNIAARLQALASPGSVYISAGAHDQVRKILPFKFVDRGALAAKNMDPIPAFEVTAMDEAAALHIPVQWTHATTEDEDFIGRLRELERLDRFAGDRGVGVIGIHAMGGAGKTALVAHWLKTRNAPGGLHCRPFEAAFSWSFGQNRDQAAALDALIEFLCKSLHKEIPDNTAKLSWLQQLCDEHEVCIFFDGLEVIQERTGMAQPGQFLEGPIGDFIWGRCNAPKSLVLLTSRFPYGDLETKRSRGYEDLSLYRLEDDDGAALLRKCGVRGSMAELVNHVQNLEGHALALRVLALVLVAAGRQKHDGVLAVHAVATAARLAREDSLANKLNQLFATYEEQIEPEDAEILALIALFPIAVKAGTIAKLMRPPCAEHDIERRLRRLLAEGVVQKEPSEGTYSAHPLLRGHFAPKCRDRAKDAGAELFDKPRTFQPATLEEAIPIINKIELLANAGEFGAASQLFGAHLGWGDTLPKLGGYREALDSLMIFLSTGSNDALAVSKEADPFDKHNRLAACERVLKTGWLFANLPRAHRLMAELGLWEDAKRYCGIDRRVCAERKHDDLSQILLTEARIEAAIGDVAEAERKFRTVADRLRSNGEAAFPLLNIADVRNRNGYRRYAIDQLTDWIKNEPARSSMEHKLVGWVDVCRVCAAALHRTNKEAARRFRIAYRALLDEQSWPTPQSYIADDAELAYLDEDWERLLTACRVASADTESKGFKENASAWICWEAEALTRLNRPVEALALVSRGIRMIHPRSWVQFWIRLEQVRANLVIGLNDNAVRERAMDDGFALIEEARERDWFSLVLLVAGMLKDAAKRSGRPADFRRAERHLVEATAVRGLEDGWAPDFGPLPGEPGWDKRTVAWAIEIEIKNGATSKAAAASQAYASAERDKLTRLAKRIRKAYPAAAKDPG